MSLYLRFYQMGRDAINEATLGYRLDYGRDFVD